MNRADAEALSAALPSKKAELVALISSLTLGQQKVIALRHGEGMSAPDIARALGWTLPEVLAVINRVKPRLEAILGVKIERRRD